MHERIIKSLGQEKDQESFQEAIEEAFKASDIKTAMEQVQQIFPEPEIRQGNNAKKTYGRPQSPRKQIRPSIVKQ